ncbi:hypothetical protein GW951_01405 [Candidatus Wolfebacteria bacterium]|nr:hypothetical protein [Candidatus Wolfebacteria bacterium]
MPACAFRAEGAVGAETLGEIQSAKSSGFCSKKVRILTKRHRQFTELGFWVPLSGIVPALTPACPACRQAGVSEPLAGRSVKVRSPAPKESPRATLRGKIFVKKGSPQ